MSNDWRIRFKTKRIAEDNWQVVEEFTREVVERDCPTYVEAQRKADEHNSALVQKRIKKLRGES